MSASIGISIFPDDGHESKTLLRNADAALYRAKAKGKNRAEIRRDEDLVSIYPSSSDV
jgi:diguanylate cyclase (GGDEF)-like protein